ncbi:MAG: tetratricopeptide (TPR) repeat protein [Polyangiales bacterium]|jgi:tetratricopeptide (TPR) repeat protein
MLKNSLLSLALIAALAPAQAAFAQDPETPPTDEAPASETPPTDEAPATDEASEDPDERARSLYLRGDRLYSEGRYEEATAAFQESYDLSGRPGLLFNLANAYERLGQLEEALQALQRFAPDAPEHQRATVNTRISTLEERLREQDEARRATEALSATTAVVPASDASASDAPATPERAPSSSSAKPVGVALLVLGAAAVGGGLAAALLARSSRAELDDACISTLCPSFASDAFDTEKRRALAADILLFGGAALVVGGVIALIVSPSRDDVARIDVAPTFGGASATLSGRF